MTGARDMDIDLALRVVAEYRDMPGLRLTVAQAARLWSMDRVRCQSTLDALVGQGLLARTAAGEYCATADARGWKRSPISRRLSQRAGRG
jgi:hypothetical protein